MDVDEAWGLEWLFWAQHTGLRVGGSSHGGIPFTCARRGCGLRSGLGGQLKAPSGGLRPRPTPFPLLAVSNRLLWDSGSALGGGGELCGRRSPGGGRCEVGVGGRMSGRTGWGQGSTCGLLHFRLSPPSLRRLGGWGGGVVKKTVGSDGVCGTSLGLNPVTERDTDRARGRQAQEDPGICCWVWRGVVARPLWTLKMDREMNGGPEQGARDPCWMEADEGGLSMTE